LFEGAAENGDRLVFWAGDTSYRVVRHGEEPFDHSHTHLEAALKEFTSACRHVVDSAPTHVGACQPFKAINPPLA